MPKKDRAVISMNMDIRVMKELKLMAIREQTTLASLASEAIITWLKWMRKAELKSQALERAEQTRAEIRHADQLLKEIVAERRLVERRRKRAILPLALLRTRGTLPELTVLQCAYMQGRLNKIKAEALKREGKK